MSDFTSNFWSIWITAIVVIGLIAMAALVFTQSKAVKKDDGEVATTGHVWDGDLEEYNHPLPRWWLVMFYLTLVFGAVYLVLYPGLGTFKGLRNWTSVGQYQQERAAAEAKYQPLYDKYKGMEVSAIAADPVAKQTGHRLYQTYCMQCHGSDARGAKGFPNLTDSDWLYGGTPELIKTTLVQGRHGQMPAFGAAFGEDKVKDVAHYVMSLSGKKHDADRALRGKENFTAVCVACHGADGKGNQALGAPNLTDNIWLYGGTEKTIVETITNGRNNQMPAWQDFLGDAKIQILTAYVWGLSNTPAAK